MAVSCKYCGVRLGDFPVSALMCGCPAAVLERERDAARAALRQLVALKDDKDAHGKTPEYEQLQPIAWQAARAVLAKAEPQEEET